MSNIIGIDPTYDYLYDPQQAKPAGFCPVCGGEVYCEGTGWCTFCREEVEPDD